MDEIDGKITIDKSGSNTAAIAGIQADGSGPVYSLVFWSVSASQQCLASSHYCDRAYQSIAAIISTTAALQKTDSFWSETLQSFMGYGLRRVR
jgi:hypothetical protein